MEADLLRMGQELLGATVDLRRRIHTHPELGLDLPETQRAVLQALAGLDLEITTGRRTSSVVAVLEGGRPAYHIVAGRYGRVANA